MGTNRLDNERLKNHLNSTPCDSAAFCAKAFFKKTGIFDKADIEGGGRRLAAVTWLRLRHLESA